MAELLIDNRVVNYVASGNGEPIVLLHGGGSSGRQWRAFEKTAEPHFCCFSPDLYGHGASSAWDASRKPELTDYALIVEKILELIGGPFHLVGHSHGGAVAVRYAAQHPETLYSLTLIEPTLMHLLRVLDSPAWPEAENLGSKHIIAVAQGRSEEIADKFLPYWIGEAAWQNMPPDRRAAIIDTMPAVAQFWASEFAEKTPSTAYAQIDVPSLLIRGTKTRSTANEIISLLYGILPNARLVEISGAGHMAPVTHAEDVNEAILKHIWQNGAQTKSE